MANTITYSPLVSGSPAILEEAVEEVRYDRKKVDVLVSGLSGTKIGHALEPLPYKPRHI